MITGMKFEYLEKSRWAFVKSTTNEKSKYLVIAFAGGALRLAMIPQPEFVKSLTDFDCDKLFLTDPLQSWYLNDPDNGWKGYEYHEQKIKEITSKYDKVLFIGNCMGGTGALLFSHLATRVLIFNPHVDLQNLKGWTLRLGVKRIPGEVLQKYQLQLKENVNKCPKIAAHIGEGLEKKDMEFLANLCKDKGNLEIVRHRWENNANQNNLPGQLKKKDELIPTLKQTFNDMIAK